MNSFRSKCKLFELAVYRLWRGLEVGASVDHYHGFPNNIATLYAGSLEWRFGP